VAEAIGEVERDGKVLVIRRIHADYYLKIEPSQRETAQRVHEMHADFCPVARTLKGCVQITTRLHMQDA
jgi:organic hydroperoxide reductase OsmC/OhrA